MKTCKCNRCGKTCEVGKYGKVCDACVAKIREKSPIIPHRIDPNKIGHWDEGAESGLLANARGQLEDNQ